MLVVYGGLIGLTVLGFRTVPAGFIPQQDKGYLVVNGQLPEGASLERTDAVVARMTEIARKDRGVAHIISVPGYSILTGTNIPNVGGHVRHSRGVRRAGRRDRVECRRGDGSTAQGLLQGNPGGARVGIFGAPPVDGLGSTGGFKMQVQDRGGLGLEVLQGAVANVIEKGNAQPGLVGLFSTFSADQPQLYVDVDRVKAQKQGVDLNVVFDTFQAYLGSAYVNDITLYNRNWQVYVQADAGYRLQRADVGNLKVRNAKGEMVPLSTMITIKDVSGPAIVNHYNRTRPPRSTATPAPGTSSGQAISLMEQVALGGTAQLAWASSGPS